jgi:hypothetical protein
MVEKVSPQLSTSKIGTAHFSSAKEKIPLIYNVVVESLFPRVYVTT